MTNIVHIIFLERRYYMNFFDVVFTSTICVLFPLLIYLISLVYMNITNDGDKINNYLFELALISTMFLIIKLTNGKYNNYTFVLLNISLLFSYIRNNKKLSILISISLVLYFHFVLKYNLLLLVIEYITYFLIYLITYRKNKKVSITIDWFTLVKTFFFALYIYYYSINISFSFLFNRVFILMIVFYSCASIYNILLVKGEDIVKINNSIKSLEKEKTLRDSLFKLTHEVKNPIAVCKGYLDMLNLNDYNTSKKYIGIVKNEIERTLIIMDDFLEYSKISIDKNIMDINYLLEDTLSSMMLIFKKNRVDVDINVSDDEIFIYGDYNRLKQVVINVLKNSIEAGKEKDNFKISVFGELKKNKYRILISDNGSGMTKEELDNLGTPFYTTKKNGTGLGVLLSREIVELHGGEIIYSSTKDEGTDVEIIIPCIET